ncbi:cation diffusion facilitator family transporter [Halomarina ordinaria]|uniref:Cation diffusion facilitator family transporter n=1 Tax=Halomarina ordinaria TaxID=3033939 RepID=A0ABD5UA69_9EURY|nr:cation diffusion facilitator family transporter [Halomarina sp. PSRA2]
MASSKSVVIAALIANGSIAVMKFLGYLLTGSPSMLSETYHSISDTGNQVFLLVGIRYSGREADRDHPFGYGKAQFFYAFLVAVLLFGIAGWESLRHGYEAIVDPHAVSTNLVTLPVVGTEIPSVWVNYAVLLFAILFETWALWKAYQGLSAQMVEHEWATLREAFRKTSDVTTLTAFTEDSIALGGAAIALVGVYLSQVTGNPIYDAVGSVVIGLMLMGFALALAWENKRLLLGESVAGDEDERLRTIIRDAEGVTHIDGFRTVYFGPEQLLLTADVSFDPDLGTETIDERITAIERALKDAEPQIRKVYLEPEL